MLTAASSTAGGTSATTAHNGWAIASADDDADIDRRDHREATSLFGLLEREIMPLFYDRDGDGLPVGVDRQDEAQLGSLGP